MKTKYLAPRKADTEKKLISLGRDNKQCGKASILVNVDSVSIWPEKQQTLLSPNKSWISISKSDFNKIVDFYNRGQKTLKR